MIKGIWVGLAIAIVAGTIMTGTMAYAASNAQGQPFQQLQKQIDEIKEQIGLGSGSFTVDSFFDVFYELTLDSSSCPDGQVPKVNEDLKTTTCIPQTALAPDSFFDVFYEIQLDTQQNTQDFDTVQTELVALELRSLPLGCSPGDVAKFNGLTRLWECALDESGSSAEVDPVFGASPASGISSADIGNWDTAFSWGDHASAGYLTSENDPQVGTLVGGKWCRTNGAAVICDVAPVVGAFEEYGSTISDGCSSRGTSFSPECRFCETGTCNVGTGWPSFPTTHWMWVATYLPRADGHFDVSVAPTLICSVQQAPNFSILLELYMQDRNSFPPPDLSRSILLGSKTVTNSASGAVNYPLLMSSSIDGMIHTRDYQDKNIIGSLQGLWVRATVQSGSPICFFVEAPTSVHFVELNENVDVRPGQ